MADSDHDLLVRIDERTAHMHNELLGEKGRVPKLEATTEEHTKQISFWRGVIWVVGGLITLVGGALLAHVLGGK